MTEDNRPAVSSSDSIVSTDASTTKQRKKRRWDEPAEILVSAGLALLPGSLPLVNGESFARISLPGLAPVSNVGITGPLASNGAGLLPGLQAPLQHAVALVQKLNPPKIQDELIAREIVINDADSSVRYKLTKRQTQEEIQKCTGAVVITRGKFIPPNAPSDGEKPLYLHISAGSHIETTVERIKAVDRAAAMVEEMLKQGNNGLKGNNLLSTCVYLGFEPDPTWSISTCIRGPNDQYINHIMNETGATVLLKGRGTDSDTSQGEGQQPLHLFLSSNNPKSLEQAKLLAENLLDTISAQFGASRVSSSKVYGAVPPPPQLLTEDQSAVNEPKILTSSTVSNMGSMPAFSSVTIPCATGVVSQGIVSHSVGSLSSMVSQPTSGCYPHSSVGASSSIQSQPTTGCLTHAPINGGTSYNGYAGIYPQATPLQQVALALRQSTSPTTASILPVCTTSNTASHTSVGSAEKEKRPPQKRKFQELPVAAKGQTSSQQELELQKPHQQTPVVGSTNVSMMSPPKNLIHSSNRTMKPLLNNSLKSSSNTMQPPPPPPKFMPPPPPKCISSPPPRLQVKDDMPNKLKCDSVPDTLIKLMEYGDDDDDE